jgi:dTDP-4-dehydrorhamnose reductase
VIRTSIIGETTKGISLVEWVKSNKNCTVDGYTRHIWNGITCLQYAKIVDEIITRDLFWKGIRHIYSPNVISKANLVRLISNVYNLNITVNDTDTGICDRSLVSKHKSLFDIPEIEQQVIEMMRHKLT